MKYALLLLVLLPCTAALAQTGILINNVSVFDGKRNQLFSGNVLVQADTIARISATPINVPAGSVQVIDGTGKFLIPGLIDAHVHTMYESNTLEGLLYSDIGFVNLIAAHAAEKQLMRGFTAVRDLGGACFGLKKGIDEGLVRGPRIFPSGATISQTAGHGDFGMPNDVPREIGSLSYIERAGMTVIADGPDQVLMRVREQLRRGASQIKIMAGGGIRSNYDALDVTQFTEAEIKAAVDAAAAWGTYVTVHAYTPDAIKQAIKAGVKCIDHGQLADEESAKLMSEQGIWWSLQPFVEDGDLAPYPEGSENRKKQLQMVRGTDNAYRLARKYNIKTAFGTDRLFEAKLAARQGAQLAKLVKWYTPVEVLKMATSGNAELLALSGARNPYPKKLGELTPGAYADMILVDQNPLANISVIAEPDQHFLMIMKNGVIYKNTMGVSPGKLVQSMQTSNPGRQ